MKNNLSFFIPFLTTNPFILGSIKDKTKSSEKRLENLEKLKEIRLYS